MVRFGIGDLTVRLCSGIFHRLDTMIQAAATYDYTPYNVPKPGKHRIVRISLNNR